LAKLKPIQDELRGVREKLAELQKNKETNKYNKDFLYSSACQIVQELKGSLKKRRQVEHTKKESMKALSKWIETFNEMRMNHYVKSAKSLSSLES